MDVVNIELRPGESGYEKIANYIRRYWNHNIFTDVVVSIGTSFDGVNYLFLKEIASPRNADDVEFLYDWWEGEKYIKLFGIKSLEEVDVCGGIYEK